MPYLIDGNNLLGSWGGGIRIEDGRHEAIRRVGAFCHSRGARAILVFDGRPFRPDIGPQELGPLSLRFPEQGQDADAVIRSIVDSAARPAELIVVTSDKALYSYAKTRGTSVLRAHEWNAIARGSAQRVVVPRGHTATRPDTEKPERETDIEGWLKRFSGE
jgi:predicted RNA-binding protein with PIN domain